jgi:hypothetical protein
MEPQEQTGNIAWLLQTVEAHEHALILMCKRIEELEREVASSVKRRDSITVGTPAKGGESKAYYDALGTKEENDKIVEEAKRMLAKMGGTVPMGGA